MKKIASILMAILLMGTFAACTDGSGAAPSDGDKDPYEEADVGDFTGLNEYGQENNTEYRYFWKPPVNNGYVGDPMPYYEDGVYSIFYLQDEGGSLRHSVYRVDTTDFIHYEYKGEALRSGGSNTDQDYWIGTGSVVKAGEDYYFFYTGHNPNMESVDGGPWEKVLLAKSEGSLDNFVKVEDFEIAPPAQYSQVDFRDPQAYYNEEKDCFDVTVETNAGGVPKIVKFTVSRDLKTVTHDGVVFEDPKNGFWNLECADITYQNGRYYLTYSAQPNDTVWFTSSDEKFSGYGEPQRLEGKHFYAPKIVEGDAGTFLVGWVYRRSSFTDTSDLYWGGHLVAHKMLFNEDGSITLTHPDGIEKYFGYEQPLERSEIELSSGNRRIADAYESFMLQGKFTFTGEGRFGLLLGYGNDLDAFRYAGYDTSSGMLGYRIDGRTANECEVALDLQAGREYSFTYIQEGSVGVLYIDGVARGALSFRTHGTNNTMIALFSQGAGLKVTQLKQFLRSKQGAEV